LSTETPTTETTTVEFIQQVLTTGDFWDRQ